MSFFRAVVLNGAVTMLAILGWPIVAMAGGEGWGDNVEEALATAEKEQKDVLMEFTGSDWCPPCQELKRNVFDHEAFKSAAPQHFVLVELDFPNNKPQSDEIKAQNKKWSEKFGVHGFPTVMLTDAKGKPYARTVGYGGGSAEEYIAMLEKLRKSHTIRDEALAKAEQAEGVEKARHLDAALSAMDTELVMSVYGEQVDQIVALDANNEAGLKGKYAAARIVPKIQQSMNEGEFAQAVTMVDAILAEHKPAGQIAQDLYMLKAQALFMSDDKENSRLALQSALDAAPEGNQVEMIKNSN